MLDLPDRPIFGPYALTRELAPYDGFTGLLPPTPEGSPDRRHHTGDRPHVLPVIRSAASLWRAMMGAAGGISAGSGGSGDGESRPAPTVKSTIRIGSPRPPTPDPAPARFLALHLADQTSHVAYRFAPATGPAEARFRAAADSVSISHPHILRIERVLFDAAGHPWIFTPYTGDVDGLRSLARLLREKNGQMPPIESERAVSQLLDAADAAHAPRPSFGDQASRAVCHGVLTMEQVLVDRHGCLWVELYGLARALKRPLASTPPEPASRGAPSHEDIRDEVRSIVEIGYQLITGLRAEEPRIPAGRLVRDLDPSWDTWFERGLDPARGFETAAEARAQLPSHAAPIEPVPPAASIRAVVSRFRSSAN